VIFEMPKKQGDLVANADLLQRLFQGLPNRTERDDDSVVTLVASDADEGGPAVWDRMEGAGLSALHIGDPYLIAPFGRNSDLSKPAATYVLAYFLGMLVRYFPSWWIGLIRKERGDAALPTLLSAVSFVERRFPQMIADLLEHPATA
jgi:hypothetical protein